MGTTPSSPPREISESNSTSKDTQASSFSEEKENLEKKDTLPDDVDWETVVDETAPLERSPSPKVVVVRERQMPSIPTPENRDIACVVNLTTRPITFWSDTQTGTLAPNGVSDQLNFPLDIFPNVVSNKPSSTPNLTVSRHRVYFNSSRNREEKYIMRWVSACVQFEITSSGCHHTILITPSTLKDHSERSGLSRETFTTVGILLKNRPFSLD